MENKENQQPLSVKEFWNAKQAEAANKEFLPGGNFKPQFISGVSKENGILHFIVKWEGMEIPTKIPAAIMNKFCPQTVIKFFSDRLVAPTYNSADIHINSSPRTL